MKTRYDMPLPGDPEPRWSALIAVLAVGGLSLALPEALTIGPPWLFPAVIVALLVPTVLTHRSGHHRLHTLCGFAVAGVLTVGLLGSLLLLIAALPAHTETPVALLRSAAALWGTNILIFALWYWRLDAGGPHHRERRVGHPEGAFVFPQMTLAIPPRPKAGLPPWAPTFVDYLFLAFTTSTALSPTDTPVVARWAKLLMMLQALISLLILVLLAARAVNIL
jgi:hypothetical protein